MDSSAIFRKKYGSFRRFFLMLGKARLPYLWIAAYLAASVVIEIGRASCRERVSASV